MEGAFVKGFKEILIFVLLKVNQKKEKQIFFL